MMCFERGTVYPFPRMFRFVHNSFQRYHLFTQLWQVFLTATRLSKHLRGLSAQMRRTRAARLQARGSPRNGFLAATTSPKNVISQVKKISNNPVHLSRVPRPHAEQAQNRNSHLKLVVVTKIRLDVIHVEVTSDGTDTSIAAGPRHQGTVYVRTVGFLSLRR